MPWGYNRGSTNSRPSFSGSAAPSVSASSCYFCDEWNVNLIRTVTGILMVFLLGGGVVCVLRKPTGTITTLGLRSFVECMKGFSYSKNGVNHWYLVIDIMHDFFK